MLLFLNLETPTHSYVLKHYSEAYSIKEVDFKCSVCSYQLWMQQTRLRETTQHFLLFHKFHRKTKFLLVNKKFMAGTKFEILCLSLNSIFCFKRFQPLKNLDTCNPSFYDAVFGLLLSVWRKTTEKSGVLFFPDIYNPLLGILKNISSVTWSYLILHCWWSSSDSQRNIQCFFSNCFALSFGFFLLNFFARADENLSSWNLNR